VSRPEKDAGGDTTFAIGQAAGDAVATIQGVGQFLLGDAGVAASGIGEVGSGGAATLVAVPAGVASAAFAGDGAVTATKAVANLGLAAADAIKGAIHAPAESKATGPVKAADAPGVTAGGQATNEHGQKLGPSGKPQANNVSKNTRERANNAANKGSGTIEDPSSRRSGPHFHTKRGTGAKKRDGTHYNYAE
jgi:hypothetical protein